MFDEKGRQPSAGHSTRQSAGAHNPIPGFSLPGGINRIGETPELFNQNDAKNIHKNVKTGVDQRGGAIQQQTEDNQQEADAQTGTQHHMHTVMAGHQAMIIGDKYPHGDGGGNPDIRQFLSPHGFDEQRTACRLELIKGQNNKKKINKQKSRPHTGRAQG